MSRWLWLCCLCLLVPGGVLGFSYGEVLGPMLADDRVVGSVGGKMWVPWYESSSSCDPGDRHVVNGVSDVMVTDEFSQVGLLVAMGDDEAPMREFFNTVLAIRSSNGVIPAWRVVLDGGSLIACDPRVNKNCDTASDATGRIVSALYLAGQNEHFTGREEYLSLGRALAADMLEFEVVQECRGGICYWLSAGSEAKRGGLASSDFAYTGYYPDVIVAFLLACDDDERYCVVAEDLAKNYLLAAGWNGKDLTFPPGKAFRWVIDGDTLRAECTNTCGPVEWDEADAARALGMCGVFRYADQGFSPELRSYCAVWGGLMRGSTVPLQYTPNGAVTGSQSGYYAAGLQAMFWANDDVELRRSVDRALSHFDGRVWDGESCYGVYKHAFAVRGLGLLEHRDSFANVPSLAVVAPVPVKKSGGGGGGWPDPEPAVVVPVPVPEVPLPEKSNTDPLDEVIIILKRITEWLSGLF